MGIPVLFLLSTLLLSPALASRESANPAANAEGLAGKWYGEFTEVVEEMDDETEEGVEERLLIQKHEEIWDFSGTGKFTYQTKGATVSGTYEIDTPRRVRLTIEDLRQRDQSARKAPDAPGSPDKDSMRKLTESIGLMTFEIKDDILTLKLTGGSSMKYHKIIFLMN